MTIEWPIFLMTTGGSCDGNDRWAKMPIWQDQVWDAHELRHGADPGCRAKLQVNFTNGAWIERSLPLSEEELRMLLNR